MDTKMPLIHREIHIDLVSSAAAVRRRVHGALGIAPKAGGPPTAIYVTRGTTGGRSIRDSGSVMDACRDHGLPAADRMLAGRTVALQLAPRMVLHLCCRQACLLLQ